MALGKSNKAQVNAGQGGIKKGKYQRNVLQAEQQTHLMALLRAVPFLQHGAELDQLMKEATLATSKSPHSQKQDHMQYSQQYISHEEN